MILTCLKILLRFSLLSLIRASDTWFIQPEAKRTRRTWSLSLTCPLPGTICRRISAKKSWKTLQDWSALFIRSGRTRTRAPSTKSSSSKCLKATSPSLSCSVWSPSWRLGISVSCQASYFSNSNSPSRLIATRRIFLIYFSCSCWNSCPTSI